MKQTNNAIKFLMAQYRAIFKNANIAMLAAIAASALAAGQAQADAHTDWTTLTGNITIKQGGDTMDITGLGNKENANPFTVNVQSGGAVTIKGSGAGAGNFVAESASILLNARADNQNTATADNATLTIGGNKAASDVANVTVGSVVNKVGKITVTGSGAQATSSLSAGSITIGDDNNSGADLAQVVVEAHGKLNVTGDNGLAIKKGANIDVKADGSLTATNVVMTSGSVTNSGAFSSDSLTISDGSITNDGTFTVGALTVDGGTLTATKAVNVSGLLTINGGKVAASEAVTAQNINVTKGTVEFAAATDLGSDATQKVNITGGTFTATEDGAIKGKQISIDKADFTATKNLSIGSAEGTVDVNGGTFTVKDTKTLTFVGTSNLNSGTITTENGGMIAFKGEATINGTTLTLGAGAVTNIETDATTKNSTLNVSSATFKTLVADAKKVKANAASSGDTAVLHFTDTETAINLAAGGVGVLSDDGTSLVDTNVAKAGDGVFAVSAAKADFKKDELKPKDAPNTVRIVADELTVGENSFTITAVKDTDTLLQVGKTLTVGDGSKELKVAKGAIALEGADGSSGNEVKASKITLGDSDSGSLAVTSGEWKVQGLTITKGKATVSNNAKLTITGDLKTTTTDGKLIGENSAIIDASGVTKLTLAGQGAELKNTSTLILSKDDVFNASGERIDANYAENAVTGDANTTIKIMDGEKLAEMTLAKFNAFNDKAGFNGLWAVKISDIADNAKTEMNIGGSDNNVQAGLAVGFEKTQASVKESYAIDKNYSVGSVALTEGNNLTIGKGAMTLQNANAHDKDGMFVSKSGATSGASAQLAGVNFGTGSTADSSLTLQGSGKIGAITAGAAGSGSVTFGAGAGKTGKVDVEGKIGATGAELAMLVNNGSTVSVVNNDVYVHEIDLNGGSFTVAKEHKLVLGDGKTLAADTGAGLASSIDGNLTAGELKFAANTTGSVAIAGNAVVDLGTLTGASGIKINVGNDTDEVSGSATLLADKLELAEATLNIDPAYTLPYASAIVQNLSGDSGDTLDGLVNVGNNALFAVGFDTKAEVDAVLGSLIKDGHFTKPAQPAPAPSTRSDVNVPGADVVVSPNAVVLNKAIKLTANGGIYVGTKSTPATGNKVEVDSGSALVITDKAFGIDPATGKKTGAAITAHNNTGGTATIAQGAKLVLVGAFNGADNELEILNGFTNGGDTISKFDVSIGGSDLLEATWNGGKLDVNLTQDKAKLASAFAGASTPVKQLMLDMLDGSKFAYSTAEGYQLINTLAMANNGAAADAAAHAATYAGAQQAAVASVTTMADAMFGRVGAVGVEAASIAATGSQANGGVWLTPMYKSVDSDGFNAQGASYGSDVDLSGVAFGTDTVNGNMRFGAVFNIGSGDAEGKGNGNGLKDEFDYYGFGIYSAMGFGNFALVGDASMTVISHEVEGLGLKGKADTTAVTMGVTGQYTVATPAVDVTPHLGARFIRLNTDSYDLTSANGVVGTTDFDVQNVFSVPLGVTLSKAFVAGGWSLAPSADLTIAFNTGDTDAKSTTRFTGINQNLDLTAEVLDEVQYGLTVGLGAQYGAFGTSFGINYTGSENTDAFGVNAQCRYMF